MIGVVGGLILAGLALQPLESLESAFLRRMLVATALYRELGISGCSRASVSRQKFAPWLLFLSLAGSKLLAALEADKFCFFVAHRPAIAEIEQLLLGTAQLTADGALHWSSMSRHSAVSVKFCIGDEY